MSNRLWLVIFVMERGEHKSTRSISNHHIHRQCNCGLSTGMNLHHAGFSYKVDCGYSFQSNIAVGEIDKGYRFCNTFRLKDVASRLCLADRNVPSLELYSPPEPLLTYWVAARVNETITWWIPRVHFKFLHEQHLLVLEVFYTTSKFRRSMSNVNSIIELDFCYQLQIKNKIFIW